VTLVEEKKYDVVIVGAGIAGAILAKKLSDRGKRVLILEAGQGTGLTPEGYRSYLQTFYRTLAKVPNSAYPDNPDAPSSSVLDVRRIQGRGPITQGYLVQMGPLPFSSDYERALGGTTLHWLGTCLRMLPNDFRLKTRYGHGVDWPISYEDLRPYYEMAENEIGVAADVKDQIYPGMGKHYFSKGYVYPMHKIPLSYLDQKLTDGLKDLKLRYGKKSYPLSVVSTPQGRNSMPNPEFNRGKGYDPVGAVDNPYAGDRCEGNASCVPICPVQAKYNALKTLASVRKDRVEIITQAVASTIEIDSDSGRVKGIVYKKYVNPNDPTFTTHTARGKVYVIAAHAVETAKLLLASGAAQSSRELGRNLMDHAILLTWGLMPEPIGGYRGPGSTSNIPTFRDGEFRKNSAAFYVAVDNWGWTWAEIAPYTTIAKMVDQHHWFGRTLRRHVAEDISRHFTLQFEFEQLPQSGNNVTIDPCYKDVLGNYRPIIRYDLPPYTRAAFAAARSMSKQIFKRLRVRDCTRYKDTDPGYFEYDGEAYSFVGAGHYIGTHRMGTSKSNSVVNRNQRTWDHENLYLVGCGNMPTNATSNPTLTMAALTFWAAENILKDLQ
jgi:choline dehydrogenase-like flavoprotein